MADDDAIWRQATDDALVERLSGAMQRATADVLADPKRPDAAIPLPAPEVATALLNLLASVLEPAPRCRTPMGMRKVTEAAGRELLLLMRGCRDLADRGLDHQLH